MAGKLPLIYYLRHICLGPQSPLGGSPKARLPSDPTSPRTPPPPAPQLSPSSDGLLDSLPGGLYPRIKGGQEPAVAAEITQALRVGGREVEGHNLNQYDKDYANSDWKGLL